jgi:Fe-S-cluster containining protein
LRLSLPTRDLALVQIVDAAMAESVQPGGDWVVCRPGCMSCCLGPFEISELDAMRLRRGLATLDPARAEAVRQRAATYDADAEDAPCPVLDPATGLCDLYEWRPITCRVFGPAVRWSSGAVGACELCYEGATDEQIAELAVDAPREAEEDLPGTTVAFALSISGELH